MTTNLPIVSSHIINPAVCLSLLNITSGNALAKRTKLSIGLPHSRYPCICRQSTIWRMQDGGHPWILSSGVTYTQLRGSFATILNNFVGQHWASQWGCWRYMTRRRRFDLTSGVCESNRNMGWSCNSPNVQENFGRSGNRGATRDGLLHNDGVFPQTTYQINVAEIKLRMLTVVSWLRQTWKRL